MIPKYEEIMLPLLKYLSDGEEHGLSETHDALAKYFRLSDQAQRELLPSGKQPVFRNRLGWARTYMKKAGLIVSSRRAYFKITTLGLELLEENPADINAQFLTRYEDFVKLAFK
jgi:restriction system protein